MPLGQRPVDHLLRRAAFGASAEELNFVTAFPLPSVVAALVDFEAVPVFDVDARIGQPGYLGVTPYSRTGVFSPNDDITDARQRWIFRMVHSPRPLQEKMALFWHDHFATNYTKLHGAVGPQAATRMMAQVPGEHPAGVRGQIELFRTHALGRYRDLLMSVACDPAMLVWLDGRASTRFAPDENFGRELLELFTIGTGEYTEADVQAAARVFTGWSINRVGVEPDAYYHFAYHANLHDTDAKSFSFPIYADGGRTIPARPESATPQDGIDLLLALAYHPATARRLARKLYAFFVNEVDEPPPALIDALAALYLQNKTSIRAMVRHLLASDEFWDPSNLHRRYAWPAEYIARAIKEVGWTGYSAVQPVPFLSAMGQTLFEPPNVGGWNAGREWFSTSRMLARINFAASLCGNQRFNLVNAFRATAASPDAVLGALLERLSPAPLASTVHAELLGYIAAGIGTPWRGGEGQLHAKIPSTARLIVGAPEYQLL